IRSKTPSSASPRRRERENRKDSDMTAKPATDTTAQPPAAPRPASTASADFLASLDERRAPSLGGFSATLLRLELIRKLRTRRTLIFTMIMPAVFYLIFGLTNKGQMLGDTDAALYISVSLAAYGAMVATTTGGAQVAVERALGWSRQLALTPLHPAAY